METKSSSLVHHHHNHHRNNRLMMSVLATGSNAISSSSSSNNNNLLSNCAACHKPIRERFLLKALDQLWHEDCLKCSCCDCRLGEVGSTLFTKANLILCKRDYLRLFGATGICSACNKIIPAFEMVMRVRGNRVYHLECFQCSQCNHRFCIGDRFHLYDNRILCEYDFEELLVFGGSANANGTTISSNGSNNKINNNNDIDNNKLKKQPDSSPFSSAPSAVVNVGAGIAAAAPAVAPAGPLQQDDGSSGYGSPDSLLSDGR